VFFQASPDLYLNFPDYQIGDPMSQLTGRNISDSTYLFLNEAVNVFSRGAIGSFVILVTQ
jgi:hypothetical protein